MMDESPVDRTPPMVCRLADPRQHRRPRSALVLWGGLLGGVLALALPAHSRLQDPPYPSREALRNLQLLVFTCGRDNQAAPCEDARRQADSLLDHPRLPGSCKDSLWQIQEQAVVASANSFGRRDRLDRTAVDMLRFCQDRGLGTPGAAPGR